MALDFFAITSYGVYPTPTPSGARRAALAVSMGLLNITLPEPPEGGLFNHLLAVGRGGIRALQGIFRVG